jgi:hypothetical protein
MLVEAIVHPLSISRHDRNFDPAIHIPVEILRDPVFQKKMQRLPVTARHHDTMRAVEHLSKRNIPLNGKNMHTALDHFHHSLPPPLVLAKKVLERSKLPVNPANLWAALPTVTPHARGPGVFGHVETFFERNGQWMANVFVDPTKLGSFEKKLITRGGALGQVSLTHAILPDQTLEPLELSFTIEGLRTGSAINRIIAASAYYNISKPKQMEPVLAAAATASPVDEADPIRAFYDQLGELDQTKMMQKTFVQHLKTVTASKATVSQAQEQRLDDLEKAFALVQEATASALNELGPSCFGNLRPRTLEESSNVMHTAATLQLVLAAAANNLNKRKRETDELDEALKEVSNHKVVAASKAKNVNAPEDEFFKELRNMRTALRNLS